MLKYGHTHATPARPDAVAAACAPTRIVESLGCLSAFPLALTEIRHLH
jgi:hypothetical protein